LPNWEGAVALDVPGTTTAAASGPPGPVMPARRPNRPKWDRVQLNTRVRVDIGQLLQRFVDDHDTTVQNAVDLALVEFLAARGYVLPDAVDG
jgi:hypothetical protein